MATHVLRDPKLWTNEFGIDSLMSSIVLEYSAEVGDDTRFGDDTRRGLAGGLKIARLQYEGIVEADANSLDALYFSTMGSNQMVWSAVPNPAHLADVDGELAYLGTATQGELVWGGAIGEKLPLTLALQGNSMRRGTVMHNLAIETVTGAGVARNLGAIGNTNKLTANLHCIAVVAGTSLDVIVESDDNSGMSSPTTRATFTTLTTAAGSESVAVTFPSGVADVWWRVSWTIVGTSYTFSATLAVDH